MEDDNWSYETNRQLNLSTSWINLQYQQGRLKAPEW